MYIYDYADIHIRTQLFSRINDTHSQHTDVLAVK
jgi:hypothetical protein